MGFHGDVMLKGPGKRKDSEDSAAHGPQTLGR